MKALAENITPPGSVELRIVNEQIRKLYARMGETTPGAEIAMSPDSIRAMLADMVQAFPVFGAIRLNLVGQKKGPKLYPDQFQALAKRTAVTPANPRKPSDPLANGSYEVAEMEIDKLTPWPQLEAMARSGADAFRVEYQNVLVHFFMVSFLLTAWRGTSRAAGDAATYAAIDKGWIEKLRDGTAGANIIGEVEVGSGAIFIGGPKVVNLDAAAAANLGGGVVGLPATAHGFKTGAKITLAGTTNYDGAYLVLGTSTADQIDITAAYVAENFTGAETATQVGDYRTLDALTADLRGAIAPELRGELAVMMGADVLGGEELRLYTAAAGVPGQKAAIRESLTVFGGVPFQDMLYVPEGMVIVTPMRNLSLYVFDAWRRAVEASNPYKGMIDWNRFELTPEIEDFNAAMAAENVLFIE